MTDDNKKDFALMVRITWQNYGRKEPDKDMMRFWYSKLENFDLQTVSAAFDKWIDSSQELPTIKNITDLCKPITPIYAAIARRSDKEANKQHAKEVIDFVADGLKKTKDMKGWARKIIANPSNYPDISFKYATEALKASA